MVDNKSTKTRFYVSKMKCDGCITTANSALKALSGFESAEYDLKDGTAVIYGDIDPQAACQALGEAGYPSVVSSD